MCCQVQILRKITLKVKELEDLAICGVIELDVYVLDNF